MKHIDLFRHIDMIYMEGSVQGEHPRQGGASLPRRKEAIPSPQGALLGP